MKKNNFELIIVGAGPSGLAAGYEALKYTNDILFIEAHELPGGLARTVEKFDCKFDIGPHRFYTKNKEVNRLYTDTLKDDLLYVNRLTRILYNKKLFNYPLSVFNALLGLGIINSAVVLFSYLKAKIFTRKINNFEDWIVSNFGHKLYSIFFKTYTEKVWGINCKEISKDWASQRIKNLNLISAVKNALFPDNSVKSLISKFYYPKMGAGQFYKKLLDIAISKNCKILFKHKMVDIDEDKKIIQVKNLETSEISTYNFNNLICSNPIDETLKLLKNKDDNVLNSYKNLRFRSHIGVKLVVKGKIFQDNWIYVHSKEVELARIANYKNFSKYMSYADDVHPLTVEYFTFDDSKLWLMEDKKIVDFCIDELKKINILNTENQVINAFIIRSHNSYPLIDIKSNLHMIPVKKYLDELKNIHTVGRCGMFKYNNQDHAILSGLYVIRNIYGKENIDLWNINTDEDYLEEKK